MLASPAAARDVLVVQSVRSALYDEAVKGFRSACPADGGTLVLADYADPELARVIREERPRLIVAVGDGALASLRGTHRAPVVSLMALGLPVRPAESGNVTGVALFAKPDHYLALFRRLRARRVGLVYDPAHTGWYVKLARAAARQYGVELVTREVGDPREAMAQLATLKEAVDALWVIPDTTAVTTQTLEAFFLFGQRQSLPVVSFSAAHLKLGALAAVEADRLELGRQAGEVARELLRGTPAAELPVAFPRRVSVRINEAVGKWLKYPADLLGSLTKR